VALGRRAEDDEGRRGAEEEGGLDVNGSTKISLFPLVPLSLLSGLPDFGGIITALGRFNWSWKIQI
jgi:hypothetical protein